MAHRLRLMCVIAVAFLASVALAQAQDRNYVPYSGRASAGSNENANANSAQNSSQQQGYGSQAQSQGRNQSQGMNVNQNQSNQGQAKEETAPPKPRYLTYTVKKKSLEEQAKSSKTLAVDFKSVPVGAVITVDGYFVGHTPTTAQIPLGKHLISITQWGYQSWEHELDVAEGKTLNINPTLHRDW